MKDYYLTFKKMLPQSVRSFLKPTYLRWSLRNFKEQTVVPIKKYNFQIILDPQNGAVDEYIFIHRNWETAIASVLDQYLKPGDVFVDVGANIGYFSLQAATLLKEKGTVIAFEPLSRIAQQLRDSVVANNFSNVIVKQLAIGAVSSQKKIEIQPGNVGGSSLVKELGSTMTETVAVSTLDQELRDLDRVNLMKIDVEGYEYEVLHGGIEILKRHQPKLVLEFSPNVYARRDKKMAKNILELLMTELGYRVYDLEWGMYVDDIDVYLAKLGRKQTNLVASFS